MKKFSFILAVIMLFTLVSCGKNAENKVIACPSQSFLKNVGENAENPPENDEKSDETEDKTEDGSNVKISDKEDGSDTTPAAPENTSKNENKGQGVSNKGVSSPSKPSGGSAATPSTPTLSSCNHKNTEIRNSKTATTSASGYTGDVFCKDCGEIVVKGSVIAKLQSVNKANHEYLDFETEMLRLVNEERKKVGVSPLEWDESLYPGTKVRANEIAEHFSHTRPDGRTPSTALDGMFTAVGENILRAVINCVPEDPSAAMVDGWVSSPGHYQNIIDPRYEYAAIAMVKYNDEYLVVNIFAGRSGQIRCE